MRKNTIRREILNLENSITKENLKLIEETTQTISVEIADNKEKAYEIKMKQ